jgi:hypothetical protein
MKDYNSEPSQAISEAAFLAWHWHGGQASGLYALSCCQWEHLTAADYARAAQEFEIILERGEADDDYDNMHDAVRALKGLVERLTEREHIRNAEHRLIDPALTDTP